MCKAVLLSFAIVPLVGCGAIMEPAPEGAVAVAITSPVAGRPVSNSVEISANAVAANGFVASVQFELPTGVTITDRAHPFSTIWNSTSVPDGVYVIRATATGDDGAATATEMAMTVSNAACLGEISDARDVPLGIPDDDVVGVGSAIQVQRPGAVSALSLSLAVRHPFPTDLDIELISPAGTPFSVWRHADTVDEDIVINDQVITRFNGEQAAGTWTLRVVDDWVEGAGVLDAWSLTIARDCGAPGL